jgi:hypothetical protein
MDEKLLRMCNFLYNCLCQKSLCFKSKVFNYLYIFQDLDIGFSKILNSKRFRNFIQQLILFVEIELFFD